MKSENTLRQTKMKTQLSKSMGCSKSSSKKEVYSDTDCPQEMRKISKKQPNLLFKGIRKRRTNNAQKQQKEGNNKRQRENT